MKTIIINEDKERYIIEHLLNEESMSDKIEALEKFTDAHFKRFSTQKSRNGIGYKEPIIFGLDTNFQVDENRRYTLDDLVEILKANPMFRNRFETKEERDKVIRQFVQEWYYRKITKNHNLTQY